MDAIAQVWKGQAGLAKTYWGWGLLGGLLWGVALSAVTPGSLPAILALLVFAAYFVIVNTGIWRAASQYQGLAVWAGLAKVAAVIGFVTIAAVALAVASATTDSSGRAANLTPAASLAAPTATKQPSVQPVNPFLDPNYGKELLPAKN